MDPPSVVIDAPPVIDPPEAFFDMVAKRIGDPDRGRRRDRPRGEGAGTPAVRPPVSAEAAAARQQLIDAEMPIYRNFYKKYIDVAGMPVLAHADVSDLALQRTYDIVTRMLAGRPDILEEMVRSNTYLIIIGKNQVYTDMPEYRNHPNPDFQNERVRGTGGNPTSFGEENLLSLPIDRYDDESIAVHEFAHTIDGALRRLDPAWTERRDAAYQNALDMKLYEQVYAGSNAAEYWAEIVQAYFDCNRVNNWNHGPVGNRQQLMEHDSVGYELCHSVFNLKPEQDWQYKWLQTLPAVTAPPPGAKFESIDPWYTKFTWAREFTVIGRGAADEALLHANETIRRMFTYRHDILKALIDADLKLVVLGPGENLSDLPDFKDRDPAANDRFSSYLPGTKVLVVSQENVLGQAAPPDDGSQVVRVMADAMLKVAGARPVIPDYRGNQQYELRVRRLDVDFGGTVTTLFENSREAGRWNGTAAATDPASYWISGVLAYFDAQSPAVIPADSTEPVHTRDRLREYDPELFQLVNETMAYENKVDWRYQPLTR